MRCTKMSCRRGTCGKSWRQMKKHTCNRMLNQKKGKWLSLSSSSCACVGLHPSCMHNPEGKHSCMCTEKPETGSSLETSKRQHDYLGICFRCSMYVIFKMVYMEIKWSILKILNMENDRRNNNWRSIEEKIVLNTYIGRVLIFSQNGWSAAYDVIWSASMK